MFRRCWCSTSSRFAVWTSRLFCTCLTPATRSTQSSARRLALRDFNVAVRGDFALHRHLDVRGVDHPVIAQLVAHILADAVVRTGVALRNAPPEIGLAAAACFLVAEPGRILVPGALEEPALLILAILVTAGTASGPAASVSIRPAA